MRYNRKNKNNNKRNKTIIKNIFLRFFTILVLTLIFFLPFSIYKAFKKSIWDGKNNINFVIQAEKTFIYSYHPVDKRLNIISLPNDLFIKTVKDYGEYKLKNIYKLGEMEKIGGGELLRKSLQFFFLVPIDGEIVRISNFEFPISNEKLEKGELISLYTCLLTKKCKTNFRLFDLLRIFNEFRKLKFNDVELIDIKKTNLFKKEKLADGSEAFKLEPFLVDDFSQKYFTDRKFLENGLKISVVNATEYQGLAKNSSRLLKNIGGEIISTKDTNETSKESFLYCADKEQEENYSCIKIKQIFNIDKILLDTDIKGDIKLIIGEDFLEQFYLK